MRRSPRNTILVGDAWARLRELPQASVDCVITSPPYYQLRDYGVPGQLGLEPAVEDWVGALGRVFEEVARVLKPTGSLWLDLADSYSRHPRYGAPAKALLLAPERLLLALTSNAQSVDYVVSFAADNAPLTMHTYDDKGGLKTAPYLLEQLDGVMS